MARIFQKGFIFCFIVASFFIIGTATGITQEISKNEDTHNQKRNSSFSIKALRNLPIMHQGRFKPFDSIARQTLLGLSGKGSSVKDDKGEKYTASEWLAESIFIPEQSKNFKVFLLENPDVADAIGLKSEMERVRYSYNDIKPHFSEFEKLVDQAISVHSASRSRFQRHLLQFYNQFITFIDLEKIIWPGTGDRAAWSEIASGYIMKDQDKFDNAIEEYKKNRMKDVEEEIFADAKREVLFNRIDPFFNSGLILCLALIFALYGLGSNKKLYFTLSMIICVVALLLQTYGHGVRMLVMGRPPVTNLYSTFIAVAWICSFVGIIIVKLLPKEHRGLSPLLSSLGPLIFLIIAGKYAYSGDTMGVMVAVLDSNFWLATHVVTITLGYGGCILAGLFAHYYIIQACRSEKNDPGIHALYKILMMIFGFGFTMTFIGGILTGGIWADQSWGRFWGWDPKENGLLLLVLWCAVVFHVKAGNLMSRFWIATGTIITIFVMLLAWFGVNKLGVGFHSYGSDPDSHFVQYMIAYLIFEVLFICITYILMKRQPAQT